MEWYESVRLGSSSSLGSSLVLRIVWLVKKKAAGNPCYWIITTRARRPPICGCAGTEPVGARVEKNCDFGSWVSLLPGACPRSGTEIPLGLIPSEQRYRTYNEHAPTLESWVYLLAFSAHFACNEIHLDPWARSSPIQGGHMLWIIFWESVLCLEPRDAVGFVRYLRKSG